MLVRQYWVWVHYTVWASVAGNGHRRLHPGWLPLADVVLWLRLTRTTALRYRLEVAIPDSPGV